MRASNMAGRRRMMQTNPNFGATSPTQTGGVSDTVIQNARRTGQLNISNRGLTEIPAKVWYINAEKPPENRQTISFTDNEAERWWEQTELSKLTAASNRLHYIAEQLGQLTALTSLDVYDNEIEMLPYSIGHLTELKFLNVSINKLKSLPDSIGHCTNLTQLDCHRNGIEILPSSIGELVNLEKLDISENQLLELPESICRLRRLRRVNARKNKIARAPSSISSLTCLLSLDLSSNRLNSVPDSFGELGCLEVLDLHANSLIECPRLSECHDLKELYLGENTIGSIDMTICRLPSLMTLDLHYNKITELPTAITSMQFLQRLDLGNNDLTSLPLELGLMEELKTLIIDGNPMRAVRRDIINRGTVALKKYLVSRMADDIPPDRPKATVRDRNAGMGALGDGENEVDPHEVGRLQTFDMSDRNLADIPLDVWHAIREKPVRSINLRRNALTLMPTEIAWFDRTLTALDLSVNKITHLPEIIGALKNLQHLDLSANRLSAVPNSLAQLDELVHIDLSFNNFSQVPGQVMRLGKLENLFMGSNTITEIDVDGFLKMSCLRTLDLQNNSLDRLPPELGLCEQLNCLKVDGNCFRIPRPALLAKGTVAVLKYLRDRIQE